jgi:hypothetical protein
MDRNVELEDKTELKIDFRVVVSKKLWSPGLFFIAVWGNLKIRRLEDYKI